MDSVPNEINGWQVATDAGSITLTKGDETITATYAHDDHELALDHAVAQAWAIECPNDAARLSGDAQWAAIVRWTKGQAGTRFNMPLPDANADESSSAPTADQVNAFIAQQQPSVEPSNAPADSEQGAK